jgi:hypothetical protein
MRTAKPILGFAAAMALYAGLAAGPATGAGTGGVSGHSSICDPMAAGAALLAGSNVGIVGRGGEIREPDLGQAHEDLPISAKGRAGANFAAAVPVYVHVITAGAIGNLTDAQIAAQITVLNRTYAGAEGGASTGFSFQLAGVTRTNNAAWFNAGPSGTDEQSMKTALHAGGANALNLYSTTAAAYLGWSSMPDTLSQPGQATLDGIVVDWESWPGTSTTYAGRFDQGETATHETGHWLNLDHTFYGGCTGQGDFVDDTPPESTPTTGCPAGKDTCSAPGLDPIHNYMDYSYDSCYTQFTPGQTQRMQDAWLLYRAGG